MLPLQNCLTMAAPSKYFVAPHLEEAQKGWSQYVPWVPVTCIAFSPAALEAKEGAFWALEEGDGSGIPWGHHYQLQLERTEQAYVAESWWLGKGQKGTSSPWSTSPKLPERWSPVISSSALGWRESISLPLIISLYEEVVELVGHHKLFRGLYYLPVTFFGVASPQLQSCSSGGNWQSCVLLGQTPRACKASYRTPCPCQDGWFRTPHVIWGGSFRKHPWTLMSLIFSFLIGDAFRI